jgi:predicted  nucleic acid-binding Zn-ribbon protein
MSYIASAPASLTSWAVEKYRHDNVESLAKMSNAARITHYALAVIRNLHYACLDIIYIPLTFCAKAIFFPYSLSSISSAHTKIETFIRSWARDATAEKKKDLTTITEAIKGNKEQLNAVAKSIKDLFTQQIQALQKKLEVNSSNALRKDSEEVLALRNQVAHLTSQQKSSEEKAKALSQKCEERKEQKTTLRKEISALEAEVAKLKQSSEKAIEESSRYNAQLEQQAKQREHRLRQALVTASTQPLEAYPQFHGYHGSGWPPNGAPMMQAPPAIGDITPT